MKGQVESMSPVVLSANSSIRLIEMRRVFDSIVQPGSKVFEQINNASDDMDMWLGVVNSVRFYYLKPT